jgi:hypothetical protein
MVRDAHLARAVDVDDPDPPVADEGEPASVGRPLRVGDVVLAGGHLDGRPAADGEHVELAGPGDDRGVGDHPVARVEAGLARRLDRDDPLDREDVAQGVGDHRSSLGWRPAADRPASLI